MTVICSGTLSMEGSPMVAGAAKRSPGLYAISVDTTLLGDRCIANRLKLQHPCFYFELILQQNADGSYFAYNKSLFLYLFSVVAYYCQIHHWWCPHSFIFVMPRRKELRQVALQASSVVELLDVVQATLNVMHKQWHEAISVFEEKFQPLSVLLMEHGTCH